MQRDECLLEHPFHLGSDFLSVIDRVSKFAPRYRIGVAAATNAYQSNDAGNLLLDSLLGATGPIAVHFVESAAESCAMTGVVQKQRADFSVRICNAQHRQGVINRTACSSPILCEVYDALSP